MFVWDYFHFFIIISIFPLLLRYELLQTNTMTTSNVLSGSGSIRKKEFVRNARIKSMKDYMILESADPFPEVHMRHKSHFVKFYYIPIVADNLDQDIKIAAQSAENRLGEELASALGDITIGDTTYHTIRLRNVPSQSLPSIVKAYEYEGLTPVAPGNNIRDYAFIQIDKFFHLEEIEEGIFVDLDDPQIGYVEIPERLEWDQLETITGKVKDEITHTNFDRALGTISKHGENTEVIRIYSPDMEEPVLKEISYAFRKHISEK